MIIVHNTNTLKVKESVPAPEYISLNESITLQGETDTFKLTILGVSIDKDKGYNIPDELEMAVVSYKIETTAENSSDDNHISDAALHRLYPYLITKSGYCLEPVSQDNIIKRKEKSNPDAEIANISSQFSCKNGALYFLVKKGDISGLQINLHRHDTSSDLSNLLEKTYIINNPEVTQ